MKQIALLMALLVTALPALAHEEHERRVYLLERKIERLEFRIDGLERKSRQAAPAPNKNWQPSAEQKKLFDCQAEASNSTEMEACAKYIPLDEALSDKYLTE
jgi:hypothetical protein